MGDTLHPERNTLGRELLVCWIDKEGAGRSQSMLARKLGIGQSSISLWYHGKSRPDAHLREALEVICGIPRGAWETEKERDVVARVREEASQVGA
jgi:ribosome-binding protein aMBF1 (putative translation factor)